MEICPKHVQNEGIMTVLFTCALTLQVLGWSYQAANERRRSPKYIHNLQVLLAALRPGLKLVKLQQSVDAKAVRQGLATAL
jgi:hypothetical protein